MSAAARPRNRHAQKKRSNTDDIKAAGGGGGGGGGETKETTVEGRMLRTLVCRSFHPWVFTWAAEEKRFN